MTFQMNGIFPAIQRVGQAIFMANNGWKSVSNLQQNPKQPNGQKRLLICDRHDSHISAAFVRFTIDHDIVIFLLLLHSLRLQKVEWLEFYIKPMQ